MYFVFLAKYPGQVEEAEKKTLQTLQMILKEQDERGTGCSLNIVFFSEFFEKFRTLFSFGVSVLYTHQAGRKPAMRQNWQSSEKSQHFKEKTQYLMNTLYKF